MPRRLVIDTDPGQDDAIALLVALGAADTRVLGVTTVAGNVPVTQTADNARRILELAGRGDVSVYAGAERPLLRPARPVPEIHGATGIDGFDFALAERPPEALHAVDWLVATLEAAPPGSVDLVALGPQTNIAMALRRAPAIVASVGRLVFMGGGFFEGGNMTPAAEYNILVDPEAAAMVLGAGFADVTAVSLDCTHGAPAPIDWSLALEALGSGVGRAAGGMVRFFEQYGNRKYGTRSRPLHDAVAVGAYLWPELFEGRRCPVHVECAGRLTTGMTVVDWHRQTGGADNCYWVRTCVDPERLYARMLACLARLP